MRCHQRKSIRRSALRSLLGVGSRLGHDWSLAMVKDPGHVRLRQECAPIRETIRIPISKTLLLQSAR
jgi:hypothetical protein